MGLCDWLISDVELGVIEVRRLNAPHRTCSSTLALHLLSLHMYRQTHPILGITVVCVSVARSPSYGPKGVSQEPRDDPWMGVPRRRGSGLRARLYHTKKQEATDITSVFHSLRNTK